MLKNYINKLLTENSLTESDSYQATRYMFDGNSNSEQVAALLVLLTQNGETVEELCGFIKAIKENAISINYNKPVVDIVGTGGDYSNSINISTASSLLVAACGVPVIKHGNRAVTSKCGSADVLQALGYQFSTTAADVISYVDKNNFAFCFAPYFNPVIAKVKQIRKRLGVRTIFNLLGPLLNPADAKHIMLGVYDSNKVELVAKTLQALNTGKSLVFHGNGLDELSCIGTNQALLVTPDKIEKIEIDPVTIGLRTCSIEDLKGDDALFNVSLIYKTLSGEDTPITDTLILNAAVALFIYGRAQNIKEGVTLVKERLKQGNVLKRNRLQEIISRKLKPLKPKKSLKQAITSKSAGAVIAEIKKASPSAGKIAPITDVGERAKLYVDSGASVISVLTDEGFEGSLSDLTQVAANLKDSKVPVFCKDFFINPQQIAAACNAGADAILIMVSVLGNKTKDMVRIAHDFGLETLVEVHNRDELAIALDSDTDVIGVNQRDLRDFSMHPEVHNDLIQQIPRERIVIAESGIETSLDAKHLFQLGYSGVLVGTTLSKLDKPSEFFSQLYD